jgi:2',3'-cyclic-nucleotide 2'-phosphodiesterase (5'-nucleotidase family)
MKNKNEHMKRIAVFFSVLFVLTSCNTVGWRVYQAEAVKIPLDKETEQYADESFKVFLQPYKVQLEKEMNEVIGFAVQDLKIHGPESLLSNFSADVYRQVAATSIQSPVDIAIVNLKGLRASVPAGNITVSRIFELMPFENELVVLWIRGEELQSLFDFFASIGGEGVSGMKMGIREGKAVEVNIGGVPIDRDKVYVVATNDYLAEGNDGMVQLKNATKRVNTGIKIRDMLIEYIRNESEAGRKINPKLDGRVYSENE